MSKHPIVLGGRYRSKHGKAVHTGTMASTKEADGFLIGVIPRVGLPDLELWSNGHGWKDVEYLGHPDDRLAAIDAAMATLSKAVADRGK